MNKRQRRWNQFGDQRPTSSTEPHLFRRTKKMKPNSNRSDELDKFFYDQTDAKDVTTPRYLWTGESWWCHCSHEVSKHKTISKSPFIARCSGSDGSCPCKEFVAYRNISWQDQV